LPAERFSDAGDPWLLLLEFMQFVNVTVPPDTSPQDLPLLALPSTQTSRSVPRVSVTRMSITGLGWRFEHEDESSGE
jgi:hypothetical protein